MIFVPVKESGTGDSAAALRIGESFLAETTAGLGDFVMVPLSATFSGAAGCVRDVLSSGAFSGSVRLEAEDAGSCSDWQAMIAVAQISNSAAAKGSSRDDLVWVMCMSSLSMRCPSIEKLEWRVDSEDGATMNRGGHARPRSCS